MRNKPWYPIVYMFVVTAAFSSVLIVLAQVTREPVKANERINMERAVLVSLGLARDDTPRGQIHPLFTKLVPYGRDNRPIDTRANPSPTDVLHWAQVEEGKVVKYAVPIRGRGFWDIIEGSIGIAADRETVIGVAFYRQSETPGLGAEITNPKFRDQFDAKVLLSGDVPLKMVASEAPADRSQFNAVSGATQTSTRLNRFLNADLAGWRDAMAAFATVTPPEAAPPTQGPR